MTLLGIIVRANAEASAALSVVVVCQYVILFQAIAGLYFAGLAAIMGLFKTHVLFTFAMFNLFAIFIRAYSLHADRWEMGYWEEKHQLIVRKLRVRFPRWFVLPATGLAAYVAAIQWPQLIAVGLLFLFFIALLLYGQIYFRRARRSLLLMRKRKLEKLDKEFTAEMNAVEKKFFVEEVPGYVDGIQSKLKRIKAELAELEKLGV